FTFFFQAEDGIRDDLVTGVQTCALPICNRRESEEELKEKKKRKTRLIQNLPLSICPRAPCHVIAMEKFTYDSLQRNRLCCLSRQIGRASCRERVSVTY